MSRLNTYLNLSHKSAGEDAKESKKEEGKEEKKEGPPSPDQASQAPPQAAPPAPPMGPPMGGMQMPTNPVDVMGQGLQQATSGMNQVIDAFYALQGGSPQAAPMPAGAPQASAMPGAPQQPPQNPAMQGQPAGAQVGATSPAPAANPQKSANQGNYAAMGGYSSTDSSAGARYYGFLRARIDQSNAFVSGVGRAAPVQPGVSPAGNMPTGM